MVHNPKGLISFPKSPFLDVFSFHIFCFLITTKIFLNRGDVFNVSTTAKPGIKLKVPSFEESSWAALLFNIALRGPTDLVRRWSAIIVNTWIHLFPWPGLSCRPCEAASARNSADSQSSLSHHANPHGVPLPPSEFLFITDLHNAMHQKSLISSCSAWWRLGKSGRERQTEKERESDTEQRKRENKTGKLEGEHEEEEGVRERGGHRVRGPHRQERCRNR